MIPRDFGYEVVTLMQTDVDPNEKSRSYESRDCKKSRRWLKLSLDERTRKAFFCLQFLRGLHEIGLKTLEMSRLRLSTWERGSRREYVFVS